MVQCGLTKMVRLCDGMLLPLAQHARQDGKWQVRMSATEAWRPWAEGGVVQREGDEI